MITADDSLVSSSSPSNVPLPFGRQLDEWKQELNAKLLDCQMDNVVRGCEELRTLRSVAKEIHASGQKNVARLREAADAQAVLMTKCAQRVERSEVDSTQEEREGPRVNFLEIVNCFLQISPFFGLEKIKMETVGNLFHPPVSPHDVRNAILSPLARCTRSFILDVPETFRASSFGFSDGSVIDEELARFEFLKIKDIVDIMADAMENNRGRKRKRERRHEKKAAEREEKKRKTRAEKETYSD